MSKAVTAVDPVRVRSALAAIRSRIERACAVSGRRAEAITIVAVTKGFGPEAISAALAAGLTDIGENYYQEATAKFGAVKWPPFPVRRHFIGRLQRNKARRVASLFDVVQTVDSVAGATTLDDAAQQSGKTLDILIQTNVAGDDRQGVQPALVQPLLAQLERCRHLRPQGLMAIGPRDGNRTLAVFSHAAALAASLQHSYPYVRMLSMGMSADLEEAVRAGTTMLRIGTGLFGERPASVETPMEEG